MKICGPYELVEQEDINNILHNAKNNEAINLEVLDKERIASVTSSEGIMFVDINDIRRNLYLRHKRNIKIKNCDFNEGEHLIIDTIVEIIHIEDSTLPRVRFKACRGFRINILNTYINSLSVSSCILDIILIENCIVDELVINSSVIRNGLLISCNSTIRKIVLKDSLVNNTQAVVSNTMHNREHTTPRNNNEIYEEVLEDVATESFKMVNSCIINNNTENTQEMSQDLKEALNNSEYVRKEDAMICGIYENEKQQ